MEGETLGSGFHDWQNTAYERCGGVWTVQIHVCIQRRIWLFFPAFSSCVLCLQVNMQKRIRV